MPSLQARADDTYGGSSESSSTSFLSPATAASPRSQPSTLNRNRSTASLRGTSIAQGMDDDIGSARFSLAHELAAALMPEPSAGSKLLSEEFGIEYDEGAEGIDEEVEEPTHDPTASLAAELDPHSFGSEHGAQSDFGGLESALLSDEMLDPAFGEHPQPASTSKRAEQDAMAILSSDLETTDKFLADLRRLDAESVSQPALERLALDWIRKIDQTTRDREGQVRELLEYEREFRKISNEIGGSDTLAGLPMLENVEGLVDDELPAAAAPASAPSTGRPLSTVISEYGGDWEVDPDRYMRGEDDEAGNRGENFEDTQATPMKDTFGAQAAPPIHGPITPAKAVPQLAHLRTTTVSLVSSLAVISEHAQVNGAATTDAGRKIRALKNKLGGWRTEWDSAERSRLKIERWEQDEISVGRRMDGRKVVEEHLRAFEIAVSEASRKTQAIMAAS